MEAEAKQLRGLLAALCASGDADGLRRLLRESRASAALPAALFEPADPQRGQLPLHLAADGGHPLCVLLLLLEHRARGKSVDPPNALQATPIHLSARAGDAISVRALLAAGADPRARTRKGKLAAELAAEKGHAGVLDVLAAAPAHSAAAAGGDVCARSGDGELCALTGCPLAKDRDASLGIGPPLSARAAALFRAAALAHSCSSLSVPGRPRVWLEFAVDGAALGRVEIELFHELVPITVENFRCLCTGEKGMSQQLGRQPLHYRGCRVHRVIPGFVIQSGDFTRGNGKGGESIYGRKFADESFAGIAGEHGGMGCVSMANAGPNTNSSQFFITLGRASHLNHKHVVFGRVTRGFVVLTKVEALGSAGGTPSAPVSITDCGELP